MSLKIEWCRFESRWLKRGWVGKSKVVKRVTLGTEEGGVGDGRGWVKGLKEREVLRVQGCETPSF